MTKITYNKDTDKAPNEIPNQKTPHNPSPLKDPASPNENNPVNPKVDEPTIDKK